MNRNQQLKAKRGAMPTCKRVSRGGNRIMNAKEQVIQMQPDAKAAIWKNKYRIVRDRLPNESVIFMAVPITGLYGTEDEAWRAAALKLTASNG